MTTPIAVVGMACRYPDARSPQELWENVMAGRRAFRRLPPERCRLADYSAADPAAEDRTYATEVAVLAGYEFDRARFRVSSEALRSADWAHWLALDVAAVALEDAGYPGGSGLPRETTGVLVGNSLTGEFSRANSLRLRWPYVRRVLAGALAAEGCPADRRDGLLARAEAEFKRPFPAVGDETLAGGLSNTIAGRICNYFHLQGGGYTVDGACASSLLAVATACSSLAAGDLDVVVAGGVDVSLDPFELVGFAKAGALAAGPMRVYDRRPTGFLPGEGCGFVVLARYDDAAATARRVYAVIRGWGVSSDGAGGITRPEVEGQLLALRRAYRRAGVRPEQVAYFEGHGTGTGVGDATELESLAQVRAGGDTPAAVLGTVKANIGHTKAAAGVAGLIKAASAVHRQVLPPTTGCGEPHPLLADGRSGLRAEAEGAAWPGDRPLYAGVSAMGFGGINAHLVIEGVPAERRDELTPQDRTLLRSRQDAELFCLATRDRDELLARIDGLIECAGWVSHAELADLAGTLAGRLDMSPVRAAVVASTPTELARRLGSLRQRVSRGEEEWIDAAGGVFLARRDRPPRIGFAFPGQGTPVYRSGGTWSCRFDLVRDWYAQVGLSGLDGAALTQSAVVAAGVAGARVMARLGLEADLAVGHSLGELTALHWAGAIDAEALLRIARVRGQAVADAAAPGGVMAALAAGPADAARLLDGGPAVVACLNSPRQTVIAGDSAAVRVVVDRARTSGVAATPLPARVAFHSPLVSGVVPILAAHLSRETFRTPTRRVVSTVTGTALPPDADISNLLCRQVTSPVRFSEAVGEAGQADLWVEVGPGRTLAGPLGELAGVPVVSLDVGGEPLGGLLRAVGAAFVLGAPADLRALFADRFIRPFDPATRPTFLASPCEQLPESDLPPAPLVLPSGRSADREHPAGSGEVPPGSVLDLVRVLVAERAELPLEGVRGDQHLLRDYHLSSIAVGQLAAEAARRLKIPLPVAPTELAHATVGELARVLEDLAATPPPARAAGTDAVGIDSWVRPFTIELVDRPLRETGTRSPGASGEWQVLAPPGYVADTLRSALAASGRAGVAVCLPPDVGPDHVPLLVEAAGAVLRCPEPACVVMVQHGCGAAGFARTLHLELSGWTTCVVNVPPGHPAAPGWVAAEVAAASGFVEAYYDAAGRRRVPVLRPLEPGSSAPPELGPDDVLLVTGGGKGIAAECAAALARSGGVRVALLGRSRPEADPVLSSNLDRLAQSGARLRYVRADVTDPAAVRRAVAEVERELGRVTAILHGAGHNEPRLVGQLDPAAFRATLGPKVDGIRSVVAAIDPDRLRLLAAFGSVIARSGLPGEADYAVANEWLTEWVRRFAAAHPRCRCLTIEWSVWSGVGMGERLGRVEALARQGISAIGPDQGVEVFRNLLGRVQPPTVVVAGRLGGLPTLEVERPELPFLRFLEKPRVYYPSVELVADAELSADSDPYLSDHVFQGVPLFPAVLGLEAMAQAVLALRPGTGPVVFEQVRFDRPISVPAGDKVVVRLAALRREGGEVELAVRCDQTAFQVDHFRAVCRRDAAEPLRPPDPEDSAGGPVDLDPDGSLYCGLLFQRGRFRRLRRYTRLQAQECVAELAGRSDGWFGPYLPADLVLGDPGQRDAAIHAVQACIPHAVVLPVGVDRIAIDPRPAPGDCRVRAVERARSGDTFVYDLEVTLADGRLRERWEGLRLRRVAEADTPAEWPPALLAPYVERRVADFLPGASVRVAVEAGPPPARRARADRGLGRLLGRDAAVARRPDGKPVAVGVGAVAVSVAHAGGLTVAVAGSDPTACDLERIVSRPRAVWEDLLGPRGAALAGQVRAEAGEGWDAAATRVWVARECVKKAGGAADSPLVFDSSRAGGWVLLRAGRRAVVTLATGGMVLGVLAQEER